MSDLSRSEMFRDADRTVTIALERPAGATYSLEDANIKFAVKTGLNSSASVFEAVSLLPGDSLAQYTDLAGNLVLQTQVTITVRTETELTGIVNLPRSVLPQMQFGNLSARLFYTVWMRINDLEIVEENSYFTLNATAVAA